MKTLSEIYLCFLIMIRHQIVYDYAIRWSGIYETLVGSGNRNVGLLLFSVVIVLRGYTVSRAICAGLQHKYNSQRDPCISSAQHAKTVSMVMLCIQCQWCMNSDE